MPLKRNALARRRLPSNRHVGVIQSQTRGRGDDAADVENDSARAGGDGEGMAERALLLVVFEGRYVDYLSAASTSSESSERGTESAKDYAIIGREGGVPVSLGTRKGQVREPEHEVTTDVRVVARDDVDAPVVGVEGVQILTSQSMRRSRLRQSHPSSPGSSQSDPRPQTSTPQGSSQDRHYTSPSLHCLEHAT